MYRQYRFRSYNGLVNVHWYFIMFTSKKEQIAMLRGKILALSYIASSYFEKTSPP